MRNDLCIECHFPLPNTEHVTWISKKVSSILSKLSKLGSHTLVTKVENLVTKQKMLLANFKRVGEKEQSSFKNKANSVWFYDQHEFFLAKAKNLVAFGTVLVAIFIPTHKHVGICKNVKPKGKLHFKTSHGRRLYQKIIKAKEIHSVSNSLKD